MRRREVDFSSYPVRTTAQHLGGLIRQARLARHWTQAALAERARVSKATLSRIEKGAVEPAIGLWLSVLEALGLLTLLDRLEDPGSAAFLDQTRKQRARPRVRDDLDF